MTFDGDINARIVEVRFASSGKVSNVNKAKGNIVKKWDLIAALDRKILQTELDRELADSEKARADFESFAKRYPDPQDDNKYTKAEKQAALNASVKDVELAKARLDQVDLFSPVDGIIIEDSNITVGQYVTPASSSVRIADINSYYFEFEIGQKEIQHFQQAKKCKISLNGIKKNIGGETQQVFSDGKKLTVKINIQYSPEILLGIKGKVIL